MPRINAKHLSEIQTGPKPTLMHVHDLLEDHYPSRRGRRAQTLRQREVDKPSEASLSKLILCFPLASFEHITSGWLNRRVFQSVSAKFVRSRASRATDQATMKCTHSFTTLLPFLSLIQAGEILLYGKNGCTSGYYDVFNALASTGCQPLPLSFGDPDIESIASSSRTIGPACTFNLYTDAKCTKLAASLASTANPKKKCITREAGFRAFKVTCKKPARVKRDEDSDWEEDEDGVALAPAEELVKRTETFPRISGGTSYYGPNVPYKNKPSGKKEGACSVRRLDHESGLSPAVLDLVHACS